MIDTPKFEINELALQYELENRVFDIFVEGDSDIGVISKFLDSKGIKGVFAYDIDSVNVPGSLMEKHSLSGGNKGRVLTLALELEQLLGCANSSVACIADRDLDSFKGALMSCSCLLWTDYPAMETYLCCFDTVSSFFTYALNNLLEDILADWEQLINILHQVSAVRLAVHEIDASMTKVDFLPSCNLSKGKLDFDVEEHIERYLNRNNRWRKLSAMQESYRKFLAVPTKTDKDKVSGHDFIELLSWYIRKKKPDKKHWVAEVLSATLWGFIDKSKVYCEPLFCALEMRIRKAEILASSPSS